MNFLLLPNEEINNAEQICFAVFFFLCQNNATQKALQNVFEYVIITIHMLKKIQIHHSAHRVNVPVVGQVTNCRPLSVLSVFLA
jgi:hypothetical protein